jgi:hypothetical protein
MKTYNKGFFVGLTWFMMWVLSPVNSQTKSVTYEGLTVPLITAQSHPCNRVKNNRINVVYFDDLGPMKQGDPQASSHVNGGDDPNAFQDLALVLGLAKKHAGRINLLAVGSTNNDSNAHRLVQAIVRANERETEVEVWHQSDMISKLMLLGQNCAGITAANPLVVAIGGEHNKLALALGRANCSQGAGCFSHKVRATLLGGYNIRDIPDPRWGDTWYYEGNPLLMAADLEHYLGDNWLLFTDPEFRGAFLIESGTIYTRSYLDQWYETHLQRVLSGVRDHRNRDIATNPAYVNRLKSINHNSRLRIADFLTVATLIWPNRTVEQLTQKSFILPQLQAALATLP